MESGPTSTIKVKFEGPSGPMVGFGMQNVRFWVQFLSTLINLNLQVHAEIKQGGKARLSMNIPRLQSHTLNYSLRFKASTVFLHLFT